MGDTATSRFPIYLSKFSSRHAIDSYFEIMEYILIGRYFSGKSKGLILNAGLCNASAIAYKSHNSDLVSGTDTFRTVFQYLPAWVESTILSFEPRSVAGYFWDSSIESLETRLGIVRGMREYLRSLTMAELVTELGMQRHQDSSKFTVQGGL